MVFGLDIGKNGNKSKRRVYKFIKNGLWIEWFEDGSKYLEILYKSDTIIHFTNCLIQNCN